MVLKMVKNFGIKNKDQGLSENTTARVYQERKVTSHVSERLRKF